METKYLQITNFAGLNTRLDPRKIMPNKDGDGVAEAQIMDNFEVTNEGAMITCQGYEKVAEISGTGGIKHLMEFDKKPDERYLLVAHGTGIYQVDFVANNFTLIGSFDHEGDYINGIVYKGTEQARRAIIGTSNTGLLPKVLYTFTPPYVTGGLATSSIAAWQAVVDGSVSFLLDGAQVDCYHMDFSGISTMDNVATIIQTAIRAKTGKLETFVWSTDHFVLSSVNLTGSSQASYFANPGTGFYDISGTTTTNTNLAGTAATGAVLTARAETVTELTETNLRGGYIMEEFQGHLFIAIGSNLYYCGTEDETTWGSTTSGDNGVILFNDDITGLKSNTDNLTVFTLTDYTGVSFSFDDSYNLIIPKKDYKRSFGCLSHKSLSSVGSNTFYWSDRGIMSLGTEENFNEMGIPRPMPLSKKIEPSLEYITLADRKKSTAIYWEEKQKYFLAVPTDNSQVNNTVFVYDSNIDAWMTRSGIFIGDLELFRDENFNKELYFGDSNNPVINKFNDSYSYNGFGYTRTWKSKIFTMGAPFRFKKFYQIEVAGSIDSATVFYITLKVDNHRKKYKVDNSFLVTDTFGEYIGDNIYGDEYFGGGSPEDSRFKRFYAPLDFDKEIREGLELEVTIENDGAEQPLKIDFIGIKYSILPPKQVPNKAYVNTQVSI